MNGLKIEWRRNFLPSSSTILVPFALSFTQIPALFVSHHKNSNDTIQADMFGYSVELTGFKTDYYTGGTIDYFAIGY